MNLKPIDPSQHALMDYVFTGVQMAGPVVCGLDEETTMTYQMLAPGFLAVNALTDTPFGLKRMIPFEDHKKADIGFLAGLSVLTFSKPIRKNKKSLCFHLGFLTLAAVNFFMTDYKKGRKR